ncbi:MULTISPECIES: serine hydrolase [unclassified Streptomyces]|uniref:serine hydrolase domain-containing protein n=1 Tax=unclassified Streptomyces TaxID=2593676 RepID=UPI000BF319C2|nr:serine hydrolase domain-containing protein [Streptomyces sp. Ru87]PGH50724.1 hydrolase [Streptomyces sp. Ru87]
MRRPRTAIIGIGLGALLTTGLLTAPGASAGAPPRIDREALQQSLDAAHEAGMYGTFSSVRDGRRQWSGASGVADVETGRPVRPGMHHRVGSITKTFTSVALLQQVQAGRLELDAPVADYVPDLVPGELGRTVTVRMLLNHTSHIADHMPGAFPSLLEGSTASLDENRFRTFTPAELIGFGLDAPATGKPGEVPGHYSNTNYVIAGEILGRVTGEDPQRWITRHVIRPAGLRDTYFPDGPRIRAPHSKMYESFYGLIDPPRDYSVYDMSWAGTAGAVVSTPEDLNRFYRALLGGKLLGRAELAEMQRTVPVDAMERYGLGIYALDLPCGRFWGHDGGVFGAGTVSLSGPDGKRQMSLAMNLMKYQTVNEDGTIEPSPIDDALGEHMLQALCPDGSGEGGASGDNGDNGDNTVSSVPRTPAFPLPNTDSFLPRPTVS